jgi:hypothetical protein
LTRLNCFRDTVGTVDVVGEKSRAQTVMGVIGFGDDLLQRGRRSLHA